MTIPNLAAAILQGLLTLSLQGAEWQPVAGNLMTRWAAEVDPQAPLPDHPRPQLVRPQWRNLNGLWDYAILPLESWQQVRQLMEQGLCAAVYTQLTDVETECNGLLTYDRKQVKVDARAAADAIRGKFAAPPAKPEI